VPLITGAGLGVEEGRLVSVDIGVLVNGRRVLIAVAAGTVTFVLLHELWSMKSTIQIRIHSDRIKRKPLYGVCS
jgi:hypothetical protein